MKVAKDMAKSFSLVADKSNNIKAFIFSTDSNAVDEILAIYQEKRKESNERLIKRKGMIGKAIGFAPMVCLFVGYLIIPLVFIGLTSMSSSFSSMTATTTK